MEIQFPLVQATLQYLQQQDTSIAGAAHELLIIDNSGTSFVIKEGSTSYLTFDTTNSAEKIIVGKSLDLNGNELILDADADTSITADTDDQIHFKVAGSDELKLSGTNLFPSSTGGLGLGTASFKFAAAFVDNLKLDGNTLHQQTQTVILILHQTVVVEFILMDLLSQ